MTGLLHALVEDAAREAGCTVRQFRLPTRRFSAIRQKAMKTAFEAGFTSLQVGAVFNRDHTTVLYAAGRLAKKPTREKQ